MRIELTARQERSRSEFRSYASEQVAPRADEFDRQQAIPRRFFESMAEHGYLASQVPGDHGGRGLDAISYGLLHEEIGRACSSVRTFLTVHDMVAEVLLRIGGDGPRRDWLPALIAGEQLAAFALTEPEAGSDAAAIRTTAIPNDGAYLLTGRKKWISFGQIADLFLVVARIRGSGPLAGFLVSRDTPGLTITPMEGLLGLRASMVSELKLDGCPVPNHRRVGPEGMPTGLLTATALQLGRYAVAWGCVGIGEACKDASLRYSQQRIQFGVPLDHHQLIQRRLANIAVHVRAARLLCLHAGYLRQSGDESAIQATLMAKYFASRMAGRVATDAVQIHGANGVSDAWAVERHFRDARIMEIVEGSTEIQQIAIAESLR